MKKVVLYGMGKEFIKIMRENDWLSAYMNIVAIADKEKYKAVNSYQWNEKSIPVVSDDDIINYLYDYIIVTSIHYSREIIKFLMQKGVKKDKILLLSEFWAEHVLDKSIINGLKGYGVDIGGPSERVFRGIYNICLYCDIINYSSCNMWGDLDDSFLFCGRKKGNVILSEATDLAQIKAETYDFVLSSNNLEHIANPLKAMYEWKRVLKKGGIMVIAVPDRTFTFDHNRDIVQFSHILCDYENDVGEDDLTHLPEILKFHDLQLDKAVRSIEEFQARSEKNIENRCLHHHVFDNKTLVDIAGYIKMEVILSGMVFDANHIIVLKKV